MMSTQKSRRGFTLIELMIVIIVIAILALIVIPKLASASRKAKESTMKANLVMVRNAIERFQNDTGEYPTTLANLVKVKGATDVKGGTGAGTDVSATYKGPYLIAQGGIAGSAGIPKNPFISSSTAEVAGTAARTTATVVTEAHWIFDNATGNVWPNATGITVDGTSGTDDYGLM